MVKLHEAHAAFREPSREQRIRGERARLARLFAVEFEGARRLVLTSINSGTDACIDRPSRIAECAYRFPDRRSRCARRD
jgi:hypothetical protein